MTEILAKIFDRFKKDNPRTAMALAIVLGGGVFVLEYLMGEGYFEGNELVPRILQVAGFLWASVNGSRTYQHLNPIPDTPIDDEFIGDPQDIYLHGAGESELVTLESQYSDILQYVTPESRNKYEGELKEAINSLYTLNQSDVVLSRLESVNFSPQDVNLPNKNWFIDQFGSTQDYIELNSRAKKDVKIFVGVFDDGVPTHKDLQAAKVAGSDFTGEGILPTHKASHSTAVGSCFSSSNPNVNALYNMVDNIEVYYVKVLRDNGTGNFGDIISGIDAFIPIAKEKQAEGYSVFANFSLGADAATPPVLNSRLKLLEDNGIVTNCANGNSGLQKISTPANSVHVDGYAAIDVNGKSAGFSNVGEGTFRSEAGVMVYMAAPDNGYGFKNGTSFSSPIGLVAYVAALSLYSFENPLDIRDYIIKTTKDLGATGYDTTFGHGTSLLRKILDTTPYKDFSGDDDGTPISNEHFRFTDGWEVMASRVGSDTLFTTFFEEIGLRVSSDVGPKVEKDLKTLLSKFFAEHKYEIPERQNYLYVGKLVSVILERYLQENGIEVSVQEVVVDNNSDKGVVATINRQQLHRYRNPHTTFSDGQLTDKNGKLLIRQI